tara:strand:+ start:205 stop:546 length:342 start_codon:yes stop_codon:yes gene_type:complete
MKVSELEIGGLYCIKQKKRLSIIERDTFTRPFYGETVWYYGGLLDLKTGENTTYPFSRPGLKGKIALYLKKDKIATGGKMVCAHLFTIEGKQWFVRSSHIRHFQPLLEDTNGT